VGQTIPDEFSQCYPFNNIPIEKGCVYRDDSRGYFTRNEIMSYARDRNQLDGMTLNTFYFINLLRAFQAKPQIEMHPLSPYSLPGSDAEVIQVKAKQMIKIKFIAKSMARLKKISYKIIKSPVPMPKDIPAKGYFFPRVERRILMLQVNPLLTMMKK
jgi:hypothetical protein